MRMTLHLQLLLKIFSIIIFNDIYNQTNAVLSGIKNLDRKIIKSTDADSDYDVETEYSVWIDDMSNIGTDDIPVTFPSFEEWCIANNRNDLLDRWDYDLNKLIFKEI